MVSNTNQQYQDNIQIWEANRDCYLGQRAIKKGGTKYLIPKGYHVKAGMKSGQPGYEAYVNYAARAIFFNGVYRTVSTMQSLIFRKDLMLAGDPDIIETYKKDFTIDNKSLNTAAKQLARETILQGRSGILVDYPAIDTSNMSQQDLEDQNIHSYAALYTTEDIINWKLQKVKGNLIATLVVLKEVVDAPWGTQFDTQKITQYRVLELDEEGYYKQTVYYLENPADIYEQDPISKAYKEGEYYPMIDGEKLDYIPFIPISISGLTWDIERSPLEDITNINIGLYNNSSDLENSLSVTAAPTLVLKGFEIEKGKEIILGGSNALIFSNGADSGAEFLEFKGEGLKPTSDEIAVKKKDMAVLGLRILSAEQNINEGADTATINQNGENSVLSSISRSISEALTQALKLMIKWDNPDEDVEDVYIQLNSDFMPNHLNSNMLNSLTIMVKSGIISDEEMFTILKAGEIVQADMLYDAHKKQLDKSMFKQLFGEGSDQDFTAPVNAERLVKPESPGDPNSPKRLPVDPGGSQNR